MKSINVTRVVLGGLVASVVVFVVAGVLPGLILARDLQAWQQSLGSLSTPAPPGIGMVLFTLLSVVFGVTGVWMYAACQPRYGARLTTALRAGFALWLSGWFTAALEHTALGDYSRCRMIIVPCACGLIGALLATVAGAAVYRE